MRFDFVSFLGGLTVGAAGAALADVLRSKKLLGQGVVTGPGGGGFGGASYAPGGFGPGVVAGPPSGGGAGSMGPVVIGPGAEDGTDGDGGPIVSVPPIIHNGDGAFGDSFFGVNVAPWFWPLSVLPIYQWPLLQPAPQKIVCKKIKDKDDEETFVCERKYPVRQVAWGPPAGWL